MKLAQLKLADICPSNPPRETNWESVAEFNNKENIFEIIDTNERLGLPKYLPKEGNHRIAKLYEKFGLEFKIKVKILDAGSDDDLFNYKEGWRRCCTEGVKNWDDFVRAALGGRWERTI